MAGQEYSKPSKGRVMALRDQPYIPLYVQDIMTDEKLNECCASTHGVYIKGIMCLMHKSETYGKILLKQKTKQNSDIGLAFAKQLVRHLPYSVEEIKAAIDELLREKVCYIEKDYLCQGRMIKDNKLSTLRAKAGKKGGEKTSSFAKANLEANDIANIQANSEYAYVPDIGIDSSVSSLVLSSLDDPEYKERIKSKFCVSDEDFTYCLERHKLSKLENSKVHSTPEQAKAAFEGYILTYIKNGKISGNGVTKFNGEDRNPANRKTKPNQILTDGEEALLDAVLSRKVKLT